MIITYQPTDGPLVEVKGIFDAQYTLAKGDAEAGVESTAPAFFCQLASLPTDPELDEPTLTINGIRYRVVERRLAGLGAIVLVLRRIT